MAAFTIINKKTKKYFSGFDSAFNSTWTSVKGSAWTSCFDSAKSQASCLRINDKDIQLKPVAI